MEAAQRRSSCNRRNAHRASGRDMKRAARSQRAPGRSPDPGRDEACSRAPPAARGQARTTAAMIAATRPATPHPVLSPSSDLPSVERSVPERRPWPTPCGTEEGRLTWNTATSFRLVPQTELAGKLLSRTFEDVLLTGQTSRELASDL